MALIEIRTLGPADINAGPDRDPRPLLAQSKRFAVLCYLALPRPGTLHRRDALLGVFWPEGDQEHSRTSLRQALAHIRRALGNDAVVRRGTEEVGLNPELVWCDVAAYQSALEEHRWIDAVEIYRGEFLEGLALSHAQEFRQWLDAKRTGLADRFAFALEELAEAATVEGQHRVAVGWWQRLIQQDPFNSRYGMQLMKALEHDGDPANALRFARQHVELLRAEFGIAPPREFEAFVEEMRREYAPDRVTEAKLPSDTERDGRGDHNDVASSSAAAFPQLALARNRPKTAAAGWGQTLALGAVAVLLILAGAAGGRFLFDRDPGLDPRRVIVLPFENFTADSTLNGLGSLAADRIGQALQQVGLAEVVPVTFARRLTEDAVGEGANGMARTVAVRAKAGIVVCGSIYDPGDSIRYHAEVIDVVHSRPVQDFDTTWPKGLLSVAVGDLGQRVSGAVAAELDPYMARSTRLMPMPPTLDALREYRLGLHLFDRGEFGESLERQLAAYSRDTTFVSAVVAAAYAARDYARKDSLARFADSRRNQLSRVGQLDLDVLLALLTGDHEAAIGVARELVQLDPSGNRLLTQASLLLRVNRPQEAIEALAKYDPYLEWRRDEADAYWHALTDALHMLGDHEQELIEARRARAQYSDRLDIIHKEVLALAALGYDEELEELLDQVATMSPHRQMGYWELFLAAGTELREHSHDDELAQRSFDRAVEWLWPQSIGDGSMPEDRLALVKALYAAHRWEDASGLLEQIGGDFSEGRAHVHYLGLRGVTAARLGNVEDANEICELLGSLHQPFLLGENLRWQARVRALLGQPSLSMRLLRDAVRRGVGHGPWLNADLDLVSLHGRADFEDFVRPNG